MSYPANHLNRQKAQSLKASSYKLHHIAVTKLYLSHVDDEGILITSDKEGFNTEDKIPLDLDHSGNFGTLQLNYKGPEVYDYFPPDSTVKVKEILLKKSSTIHEDVHDGSWDIIHSITEKESDRNYSLKKAIEDKYTVILAIQFEIIDGNKSSQVILYPHSKKGTPLHRAVAEKDMKIIETLLDYKLDINDKNECGWTPLHVAVDLELSDVVDHLISNGADVNAQNRELQVPLHYAVTKSNLIILDSLLKRQVKLDVIDKDKQTPLHYAVNAGNADAVDILLKKGANYNLESSGSHTAFHLAVERLNLDIIKVFLKNNEDADILNSLRRTPLFYASFHSQPNDDDKETYLKNIDVFLKKGADINFQDAKGYTLLYYAMLHNNTFMEALLEYNAKVYLKNNCVQTLLNCDTDINAVNKEEKTALHVAVKNKNYGAVELILEKNPNINIVDGYGNTALHLALQLQRWPIFELLLKNKADVNLKNKFGQTALHLALEIPNITINIIKSILSSHDINTVDNNGRTALHIATRRRNCDAVELILKKNPNINMTDKNGKTALHLALEAWNLPIIELLLEHKADGNLKDKLGQTALHVALEIPDITINIIKSILSSYDINTVDNYGRTALHIATRRRNCDAVEIILELNPNINMVDRYGNTALHLALRLKCWPIIELLLKNKADVSLTDSSGQTALHLALEIPDITINIIKSILNSTNDINAKDSLGKTAIHYAALNHNVNTLRYLLEENADVNAKDFEGKTALHSAIIPRDNDFKCVEVLLDHKADINAVDNNLVTPLHLACFIKNVEVVKYLIKNGADSSMRDKDCKTVFHYACMDKLSGESFWLNDKIEQNCIDNILILLSKEDISVNCVDNLGKTPLHYVAVNDRVSNLNELLLNIGADINIVDKNNNTAFDVLTKQSSYKRYNRLKIFYKQHIVKMKVLKSWVLEKTLDKIYRVDNKGLQWIQSYENNCNREIDSMKTIILGESNITYYDFLKKSPHDAVNYTRNQNIVNAIQSDELITMFPIYGLLFKNHLRNSQRRSNLYDQIQESLNICLFKQLPTLCMSEILKYLDNSELTILLKAMKSSLKKNC